MGTYLGYLAQSSALLSEVDHHTTSTILGLFDGFFDAKYKIRAACANIRSEHIAPITLTKSIKETSTKMQSAHLIMNSQRKSNIFVRHLLWVPKTVDCQAALESVSIWSRQFQAVGSVITNWGKENLDIASSNQLQVACVSRNSLHQFRSRTSG